MLLTALLSFLAGLLTALAPCVLPLLPVILGGSFDQAQKDKKRPYIITTSLVASLVLFTILLKASTALINIDPKVWAYLSGGLVIVLGIFMLLPELWAKLLGYSGIEHRSQSLLGKAFKSKNRYWSAILTGAALGPVFSSCSPTYAWVIATVLPASKLQGVIYLSIYCAGVAVSLLTIALLGRKLLAKIKWAANPKGWFQRALAILFILVGIFVVFGLDKKVQTFLVDRDFLNLIKLEQKLVPNNDPAKPSQKQTAPEITDVDAWINSEPLSMAQLKGKVVLVDFWTYSCINCQRTQPYLNDWYQKYKDQGLIIIGMHAPEFSFERVRDNVAEAVTKAGIKYPVALDNNFTNWQAYHNQYWPAKYLIDKDGQIKYAHFGEGEYDVTETKIQQLLREAGQTISTKVAPYQSNQNNGLITPETYLGYKRAGNFSNTNEFKADTPVKYQFTSKLEPNSWSLDGNWQVNDESIQALGNSSKLKLNFTAREVYLVMSGQPGSQIMVDYGGLNNVAGGDVKSNAITLDSARLYKLIKAPNLLKEQQITLTLPAGASLNAFTFGG